MPATIAEEAIGIEEESRTVSKPAAKTQARENVVLPAPNRSLARSIFEGHGEFLGCTPD
jgi:hypothetical protein